MSADGRKKSLDTNLRNTAMLSEVRQYINSVPQNRRKRLMSLHAMIVELYPTAIVDMQYKMPTYHVGEGWVAIANQKHYVSVYTCTSQYIEQFKKKYPTINTGKGCIRFKDSDVLPLSDIQSVVKYAINYPKS